MHCRTGCTLHGLPQLSGAAPAAHSQSMRVCICEGMCIRSCGVLLMECCGPSFGVACRMSHIFCSRCVPPLWCGSVPRGPWPATWSAPRCPARSPFLVPVPFPARSRFDPRHRCRSAGAPRTETRETRTGNRPAADRPVRCRSVPSTAPHLQKPGMHICNALPSCSQRVGCQIRADRITRGELLKQKKRIKRHHSR